MPSDPSASDICVSCGLCCNGALFDYGELEEQEWEQASLAGLSVSRVNERPRFQIPCTRLVDKVCTVYEARPGTCRAYRCQLLKRFDAGELTAPDASGKIEEAQALIARIKALLPEGMDLATARSQWAKTHKAAPATAGEAAAATPQLTLLLFMLNRLLDRHFRKAHQRMMSTWHVDEASPEK